MMRCFVGVSVQIIAVYFVKVRHLLAGAPNVNQGRDLINLLGQVQF
jgi:hypothetical protein